MQADTYESGDRSTWFNLVPAHEGGGEDGPVQSSPVPVPLELGSPQAGRGSIRREIST
jgi:hypothetical protein